MACAGPSGRGAGPAARGAVPGGRARGFRAAAGRPSSSFRAWGSTTGSSTARGAGRGRGGGVRARAAAGAAAEFVDYYAVLNVAPDADLKTIKSAYRQLAKVCHPDKIGDEGHELCILLNEAYTVLRDADQREEHDVERREFVNDGDGYGGTAEAYTGEPLSKWCGPGHRMTKSEAEFDHEEDTAVFVDEINCIGCRMCISCAAATFRVEEEWGRARVFAQWVSTEDQIQEAIDSCPVSCIHWVSREDLPALEYAMQHLTGRVEVHAMQSSAGVYVEDVFAEAEKFLRKRREKAQQDVRQEQRAKAAQQTDREAAAARIRAIAKAWEEDMLDKVGLGRKKHPRDLSEEVDLEDIVTRSR